MGTERREGRKSKEGREGCKKDNGIKERYFTVGSSNINFIQNRNIYRLNIFKSSEIFRLNIIRNWEIKYNKKYWLVISNMIKDI